MFIYYFLFIFLFFYLFIIILKRSFFFYIYIYRIDNRSIFFPDTVRVIIALKRSEPIYKTNCSDDRRRPLFIALCMCMYLLAQITGNIQLPRACSRYIIFVHSDRVNRIVFCVPPDFYHHIRQDRDNLFV